MNEILMVVYLVIAIALIGFILVQQGKGAGMGASFGQGASGTVFGASGSGNFLTKTTTILAVAFFGVALGLGNITAKQANEADQGLFGDEMPVVEQPVPAEQQELPTPAANSNSELPTMATPEDAKAAAEKAKADAEKKAEQEQAEAKKKADDGDTQP